MSSTITQLPQWEHHSFQLEKVHPLPVPIGRLPIEVIALIFGFVMDDADICNLELVCKKFYQISRTDDQIWRKRFELRWPLILLLPLDEKFQPRFKLFRYHSNRVNAQYTVKQLREKIFQLAEKPVNRAGDNYLALADQRAKSIRESMGEIYGLAKSPALKKAIELNKQVNEAKALYDSEKSKYESVEAAEADVEAYISMKNLLVLGTRGVSTPALLDKAKNRAMNDQLDYHFETHFPSICEARLSVLKTLPRNLENLREMAFLQKAQKSHQCQDRALKIKKDLNEWINMFQIPAQWLTLSPVHHETFSKLSKGEQSLLKLEQDCLCCKEGKSPLVSKHDSSNS